MENLFSDNAYVMVQGEEVLDYLGPKDQGCTYEIVGFEKDQIEILDNRLSAKRGLENFLKTGDATLFLEEFCKLAYIQIFKSENGKIKTILNDPTALDSNFYLWVVVGINQYLPAHEYIVLESVPIKGDLFAIFSIYQFIPQQEFQYPMEACHRVDR